MYSVADEGRQAVVARRDNAGLMLRTIDANELANSGGLAWAAGRTTDAARLIPAPIEPGSFAEHRLAELDGARLLLFDGARDNAYIGSELTVSERFAPQVDAALATLDHMQRRYGRSTVDGQGGLPADAGRRAHPRGAVDAHAQVAGGAARGRRRQLMERAIRDVA